jgi:hypoxanthine phosphoribosyltransferase
VFGFFYHHHHHHFCHKFMNPRITFDHQLRCLKFADPSGKHVILIEDIVDTGTTMNALLAMFPARNVASVKLASLFDKPGRRKAPVTPDYCGFSVADDAFIVGYGLDFDNQFRSLPFVGVLKPEAYGASS